MFTLPQPWDTDNKNINRSVAVRHNFLRYWAFSSCSLLFEYRQFGVVKITATTKDGSNLSSYINIIVTEPTGIRCYRRW